MFRTVAQSDVATAKPSFAFVVNLNVKAEVRDIHVDERTVMVQRTKRIKGVIFMMVSLKTNQGPSSLEEKRSSDQWQGGSTKAAFVGSQLCPADFHLEHTATSLWSAD
jgi:hypothetical protein